VLLFCSVFDSERCFSNILRSADVFAGAAELLLGFGAGEAVLIFLLDGLAGARNRVAWKNLGRGLCFCRSELSRRNRINDQSGTTIFQSSRQEKSTRARQCDFPVDGCGCWGWATTSSILRNGLWFESRAVCQPTIACAKLTTVKGCLLT
jgi:hypothetical protein